MPKRYLAKKVRNLSKLEEGTRIVFNFQSWSSTIDAKFLALEEPWLKVYDLLDLPKCISPNSQNIEGYVKLVKKLEESGLYLRYTQKERPNGFRTDLVRKIYKVTTND